MELSKLPYLEGLRTRFYNRLDKELNMGSTLLETRLVELTFEDCRDINQQVSVCIDINTFSDKLEQQSETLVLIVGDADEGFM